MAGLREVMVLASSSSRDDPFVMRDSVDHHLGFRHVINPQKVRFQRRLDFEDVAFGTLRRSIQFVFRSICWAEALLHVGLLRSLELHLGSLLELLKLVCELLLEHLRFLLILARL